MVVIFRDRRPISDISDIRLQKLNDTDSWLKQWNKRNMAAETLSESEKGKTLMSKETYQDTRSMLRGYEYATRLGPHFDLYQSVNRLLI